MQKFSASALSALAAATLLAGCASVQKSSAWASVRAVRHAGPGEISPASAYAAKLHQTLQDSGIDHKIVTVKFRYHSRILLDREGEETAVIYRDPATPANPWWLMSERLTNPMWLPTKPIASQVAFYLSRPVSIVKVEDFPAKEIKHAKKHKRSTKAAQRIVGEWHLGYGTNLTLNGDSTFEMSDVRCFGTYYEEHGNWRLVQDQLTLVPICKGNLLGGESWTLRMHRYRNDVVFVPSDCEKGFQTSSSKHDLQDSLYSSFQRSK